VRRNLISTRQVAILVKEKDQSFKTIGIRSLFGHFPTEKSKITPAIKALKESSYNFHGGRFYSLFRGYRLGILALGFYDLRPNDGA
jgi:hypothetical protein